MYCLCASNRLRYCHGLPVGRPIGLAWTPHWASGVWHIAENNTADLVGNGTSLIAHSVEDPFAWHAPSRNPAANGSFHMLFHAFQMGMVNNSGAAMPGPGTAAGDPQGLCGFGI